MTVDSIRILLVDDHDVVRAGLRSLFDNAEDLEVVGEASSSEDAMRRTGLDLPDVVVLDVRLPDGSGIDVCREIKTRWPETGVLILTSYADQEALMEAYDAGASGYILKRVDSTGLTDAVRQVGRGEQVFGEILDAALARRIRSSGQASERTDLLSLQEKNVLELLAQGKSNKQIAEEMFLSDKTVKNYVSHILSKLEMTSRTEAATYAVSMAAERKSRYAPEDWATD
ncbi:MAG: response regulator transcription factor [Actinomycetia bacterium]|nr:response regulator transcription factor [Actinomycetes bacterium]